MALDTRKYERKHTDILRDTRPLEARIAEWLKHSSNAFAIFFMMTAGIVFVAPITVWADFLMVIFVFYFWRLTKSDRSLAFKLPMGSKYADKNNKGAGRSGKGEGILYLGNVEKTNEEVWFTNNDARTHCLYLGTTGSGKTEGLKSMVTNALSWGSGFVYIDGKADTDLWSSLSSLVKRFGRDDDLLVLNYMTGNSDRRAPSNTMNPFSSGSASYLTNMLVSLMPEAEGDNAMWKERAVSLIGSLMPALTWKRDNQDIPTSVSIIREYLNLNNVIKISRDQALPEKIRMSIKGYLDTLPGYNDAAFDDQGREKPAGPDQPMIDTTTPRQQHGYLAMQFTRSLQSLGDDYGYIFDSQAADVEMVDVVLNRRILIVLIPALEKSADETANLGKIVAATIKGMMGSTLGATVEGESATVIENKPTTSSTPFMCVFDEVGYYTAAGMAVMAAQARSLGFCLIYSAQDLPALEKRVKEEARSITANCNIKIFGKLEDPTQTKEFFEKTVGSSIVMEASGFQLSGDRQSGSYYDTKQAGVQIRARASYDGLKGFREGQAVIAFGSMVVDTQIFYSNPGFAKAMRVTRYISLPPPDEQLLSAAPQITKLRDLLVHKSWTAMKADVRTDTPAEIHALDQGFKEGVKAGLNGSQSGMVAIANVFALTNPLVSQSAAAASGDGAAPAQIQQPAAQLTAQPADAMQAPIPPIFAKRPAEDAIPVQAATSIPSAPVQKAATAPAASGGNPMAFFKKPEDDDAAAPASEPAAPAAAADPAVTRPLSWEEIMKAGNNQPAGQTTAQAPGQTVEKPRLDKETELLLRQAGEATRNALFGKALKGSDGNE